MNLLMLFPRSKTAIYAEGAGLGASKGKEVGKFSEGGYLSMAQESVSLIYSSSGHGTSTHMERSLNGGSSTGSRALQFLNSDGVFWLSFCAK